MGCGCGSNAVTRRTARLTLNAKGPGSTYPLLQYEGCSEVYPFNGPRAGDSVLIVARGTPSERMFRRTQAEAASDYQYEEKGRTFENIPTTALCRQAVEAVFA